MNVDNRDLSYLYIFCNTGSAFLYFRVNILVSAPPFCGSNSKAALNRFLHYSPVARWTWVGLSVHGDEDVNDRERRLQIGSEKLAAPVLAACCFTASSFLSHTHAPSLPRKSFDESSLPAFWWSASVWEFQKIQEHRIRQFFFLHFFYPWTTCFRRQSLRIQTNLI